MVSMNGHFLRSKFRGLKKGSKKGSLFGPVFLDRPRDLTGSFFKSIILGHFWPLFSSKKRVFSVIFYEKTCFCHDDHWASKNTFFGKRPFWRPFLSAFWLFLQDSLYNKKCHFVDIFSKTRNFLKPISKHAKMTLFLRSKTTIFDKKHPFLVILGPISDLFESGQGPA